MSSAPFTGIYLASQSPRRRELLTQIGVPHRVLQVSVPEVHRADELAIDYVQRLAQEKALAGDALRQTQGLDSAAVLGADTIVVLINDNGSEVILEKPKNEVHFREMMHAMSGRAHLVMTAVALALDGKVCSAMSTTQVRFRTLSDSEIAAYWLTGEPCDKAGGYGIQGFGAVFVDDIQGSYSGVVGLPLAETAKLLKDWNLAVWQSV